MQWTLTFNFKIENLKTFVKQKLKKKQILYRIFLNNWIFHQISTLMDSLIRHRQAPGTSVGQSGGLGLHLLFSEKLPWSAFKNFTKWFKNPIQSNDIKIIWFVNKLFFTLVILKVWANWRFFNCFQNDFW